MRSGQRSRHARRGRQLPELRTSKSPKGRALLVFELVVEGPGEEPVEDLASVGVGVVGAPIVEEARMVTRQQTSLPVPRVAPVEFQGWVQLTQPARDRDGSRTSTRS